MPGLDVYVCRKGLPVIPLRPAKLPTELREEELELAADEADSLAPPAAAIRPSGELDRSKDGSSLQSSEGMKVPTGGGGGTGDISPCCSRDTVEHLSNPIGKKPRE